MDEGNLLSDFHTLSTYNYETHGFTFTVLKAANAMTTGLSYRFRIRSKNSMGFSAFSDTLIVGLGSLPSQPLAPYKSLDESLSSSTSIMIEWDDLDNQDLPLIKYTLYMDDGFGVTFNPVFESDETSFYVEGLTPGIYYTFYLTATNFNGEGSTSPKTTIVSCISPQNV